MDINQVINSFIQRQQTQNIPLSQIEESIFIAFNVSLVKTLKELEKEVSESKIQELTKKLIDLRKKAKQKEIEKLLISDLNGHQGVYKLFIKNLDQFLKQL